MLTVKTFVFNPLQENTYVVWDESRTAAVIDPGCYESFERRELENYILEEGLTVSLLLNTHCHFDHVLGNDFVKEKYGVPFVIGSREMPVLTAVKAYVSNYGFPGYREAVPDRLAEEGETVAFGNTLFRILFLPGHSPGHIGFYYEPENILISGDVLFRR